MLAPMFLVQMRSLTLQVLWRAPAAVRAAVRLLLSAWPHHDRGGQRGAQPAHVLSAQCRGQHVHLGTCSQFRRKRQPVRSVASAGIGDAVLPQICQALLHTVHAVLVVMPCIPAARS